MVRFPPFGMASRALTARFMMTCSICPGSAFTCASAGSRTVRNFMSSPIRRCNIFSILAITVFRSSTWGVSTCCRLKASSCRVRDAARSPAPLISFTNVLAVSSEASISRRSSE